MKSKHEFFEKGIVQQKRPSIVVYIHMADSSKIESWDEDQKQEALSFLTRAKSRINEIIDSSIDEYFNTQQAAQHELLKTNVSSSSKHSILDVWAFAEWTGQHYIRLHECWVHRFSDQRIKDNWKDTGELWRIWWDNYRQHSANKHVTTINFEL